MATIKCTIDKSDWYEMYIEYTVTQDPINALSIVRHALKLKQLTNGYDFAGTMTVTYKIGDESFDFKDMVDIDDVGDAGYTITIKSGTTVILHNKTTGAGSFYVECSGSCNSAGYGPGDISIKGQNVALPTIDRVAPTVSLTIQNISTTSATVTARTTAVTDLWEYSLDNGKTWTKMPSTAPYMASYNIQGLVPNVDYIVNVRARREYNQVYGASNTSFKTLGSTLLNSVNTLVVDAANPVLTMNLTVYTNYTHRLDIRDGGTTVLTIDNLECSIGTNNKTITLVDEQRGALLEYMSDRQSFVATFSLSTFDNGTQIGSASDKTATIQTTAANSAPMFESFEHKDSDTSGTVAITGDESVYIKGYSSLQITIKKAGAKNKATVESYRVTVGADTKEFDTPVIDYGTIGVAGDNIALKVEVVDSRGYSTELIENIVVLDYFDISINDYTIRRKNEVEPTVQLAFSGEYCPITLNEESRNGVISSKLRYAPSGGEWSDWVDAAIVEGRDDFEFATVALSNGGTPIEFDPNSQYTIDIQVEDRLSADTMTIILNKGTPLMSFRSKKVGVNEPNPTAALHIRGEGELLKLNDMTLPQLILETMYPVGSIYTSVNATSPSELFGGEWEQIKDRFLLAAGESYEAGSVGGEAKHKLTVAEMPTHTHNLPSVDNGTTGNLRGTIFSYTNTEGTGTGYQAMYLGNAGGDIPHNNMPPYIAVYMWQRTK